MQTDPAGSPKVPWVRSPLVTMRNIYNPSIQAGVICRADLNRK
jgi:hypothetical protein